MCKKRRKERRLLATPPMHEGHTRASHAHHQEEKNECREPCQPRRPHRHAWSQARPREEHEEKQEKGLCRGSCRKRSFGIEPPEGQKKKAWKCQNCRSACRAIPFDTETLKPRRKARAEEPKCRSPCRGMPFDIEAISRLARKRDGARVALGLFLEFPSLFHIPINRPLCYHFRLVQPFGGQKRRNLEARILESFRGRKLVELEGD